MSKFDDAIAYIRKYSEADEQRRAAFYFVRNIPYSTIDSHSVEDAIENNRADCYAKANLLEILFQSIGYKTRLLIARYRLKDFPPEVRFIPGQIDYHYAVQVHLMQNWITVDATYDPALASIGFVINDWDGLTGTPLSEIAISQKIVTEQNPNFDRESKAFGSALKEAYKKYENEITNYRIAFNRELDQARNKVH